MDTTALLFTAIAIIVVVVGGIWMATSQGHGNARNAARIQATAFEGVKGTEIPLPLSTEYHKTTDGGIEITAKIRQGMVVIELTDLQDRGDVGWLIKSPLMIMMPGEDRAHSSPLNRNARSVLRVTLPYANQKGVLRLTNFKPVVEKPQVTTAA